jgi:hypothetical protein
MELDYWLMEEWLSRCSSVVVSCMTHVSLAVMLSNVSTRDFDEVRYALPSD